MYEGRVHKQTRHNRLSSPIYKGRIPKQTIHKQTSQHRLTSPMYEGRVVNRPAKIG